MARKITLHGISMCAVVLLVSGICSAADFGTLRSAKEIVEGQSNAGLQPGEVSLSVGDETGAAVVVVAGRSLCNSSGVRVSCLARSTSTRTVSKLQASNKMCVESTCSTWNTYYRTNFYGWVKVGHYYDSNYYHNYTTYGRHLAVYNGVAYRVNTSARAYL
jgi:hypothetical protein